MLYVSRYVFMPFLLVRTWRKSYEREREGEGEGERETKGATAESL